MVAISERLKFPMLAGSSLPVTWCLPTLKIPIGAQIEEARLLLCIDDCTMSTKKKEVSELDIRHAFSTRSLRFSLGVRQRSSAISRTY